MRDEGAAGEGGVGCVKEPASDGIFWEGRATTQSACIWRWRWMLEEVGSERRGSVVSAMEAWLDYLGGVCVCVGGGGIESYPDFHTHTYTHTHTAL